MKSEKILTISIAAYNVEQYIKKALDSLIDDEIIDDLEIFVVDDGGTDDTLKIAQEYADRYPDSIFPVHKENGGYGSTINTSIELATGKYFKQLDGDDYYQTENLKCLVKELKTTDVDCVLTYHYIYYEKNKNFVCVKNFDKIAEGEYYIDRTEINERFSIKNATYKTAILKNMKERLTEHCFYTDAEFASYPVAYVNTVRVYHLPIYVYRIGIEGQSVSAAGIKKHYLEQEKVFWNVLNFYNKNTKPQEPIRRQVILQTLAMLFSDWYIFRCVLPMNSKRFKEIKAFSKRIKDVCPDLIAIAKQHSKVYKGLRYSGYLLYPIAHLYYLKKKQ